MNKSAKVKKVTAEVDKFLDSLKYSYVANEKPDVLYQRLFREIANIAMRHYEDIDITANMELYISTDTMGDAVRTVVTGYIRAPSGQYIQIEKIYLPEGVTI